MNKRWNTKDILLVDDDINHLNIFGLLLRSEGFEVTEACDTRKALKMMESNSFRIVITDFDMPEMNGCELAITAIGRNPDTNVFLVTGCDLFDIAEAASSAGISEIFTKPVDLRRLLRVIRSLIPVNTDYENRSVRTQGAAREH